MKQERKVRRQAIYATTAGPVTEIGLKVSPDGSVQFVTDVVDTSVETSYERPKGPKVIERIALDTDQLHFDPDVAIFTNFDRVFAVDTNTKYIDGVSVSITAVTEIVPPKPCGHGTIRLIFLLEFMQVTAKPELVGWLCAALDLTRAEEYRSLSRIALVVDSELSDLPTYNARTRPLLTGVLGRDRFLPERVTLIFATFRQAGLHRQQGHTLRRRLCATAARRPRTERDRAKSSTRAARPPIRGVSALHRGRVGDLVRPSNLKAPHRQRRASGRELRDPTGELADLNSQDVF